MREAAANAGLSDTFVQIRELGDFSVLYRAAGLLQEVESLISARSRLREATLDALHGAGIEIVSPNFMNKRELADNTHMIPRPARSEKTSEKVRPEEVAFDKADEAASVEGIRNAIEVVEAELATLNEKEVHDPEQKRAELDARKVNLIEQLRAAEERRKASDQAERTSSGH